MCSCTTSRPGAVERLGFGYDALRARNPRLIWCGISGYGPDGPYRDSKAYDLLVQGESGVVVVHRHARGAGQGRVSIADIAAGMYAYSSILAALVQRASEPARRAHRHLDAGVPHRVDDAARCTCGTAPGSVVPRVGVRHNMIVPYGAYACADGAVNVRRSRTSASGAASAPRCMDDAGARRRRAFRRRIAGASRIATSSRR